MRSMFILTIAFAVGYSALWVMGRQDRVAAVAVAEARLASAGIDVSYDDLRTRGFPSRHDTRVWGLVLDGEAWRWEVPDLEIASLSYRPGRQIWAFPQRQVILIAGRQFELLADRLRASTRIAADGRVLEVRLEGTDVQSPEGRAGRVFLALRLQEETTYDVYLELAEAQIGGNSVQSVRISGTAILADRLFLDPDLPRPISLAVQSGYVDINGKEAELSGSWPNSLELDGPGAADVQTLWGQILGDTR